MVLSGLRQQRSVKGTKATRSHTTARDALCPHAPALQIPSVAIVSTAVSTHCECRPTMAPLRYVRINGV